MLNAGKKFKYDIRTKTSALKNYGIGTFDDKDFSHDDTKLAAQSSATLTKRWNVGTISGHATLTGIDYHSYSLLIGTAVRGIDGRNVGFNVSPKTESKRFPTIVGAQINFDRQSIDLVLDSFRGELAV